MEFPKGSEWPGMALPWADSSPYETLRCVHPGPGPTFDQLWVWDAFHPESTSAPDGSQALERDLAWRKVLTGKGLRQLGGRYCLVWGPLRSQV